MAWVLGVPVVALVLWLGPMSYEPAAVVTHRAMALLWTPILLAGAAIIATTVIPIIVLTVHQLPRPARSREEPRLPPLRLEPSRSHRPIIGVTGLERGSGASSIAFNLAVLLATEGVVRIDQEIRRPRPACLLDEGALTSAMGLSADSLDDYLGRHPYRMTAEIVNQAVWHPSGCELFCIRHSDRTGDYVRQLLVELRHHYDAIFVDCKAGDWYLSNHVLSTCDAFLLVGLPHSASLDALELWADRIWGGRHDRQAVVVVNKVHSWPDEGFAPYLPYLQFAPIPYQPEIPPIDGRGLPWALDYRLSATRRLHEMARQLLPAVDSELEGVRA